MRFHSPVTGLIGLVMVSGSANDSWSQSSLPLNPAVTQATIEQTICVRGWTKTVRPPVSYTGSVKHKMMADSGVPPEAENVIKLDYKIPNMVMPF
jgi:hypothetical protein